jgi:ATP-dependent Lon protease
MRELPVLPLRDPELIIFPGQVCEIDVGRPFSLNAIKSAQEKYDNRIIIAFQNNLTEEQPKAADFYTISMEAEIKQVTNVSATGASRVIILGVSRLYLRSIAMSKEQDCYVGKAEPVIEQDIAIEAPLLEQIKALRETIKIFYPSVLAVRDMVPKNSAEFSLLVDEIAHQLKLPIKEKFGLLKQKDPKRRFDKLMTLVSDSVNKSAVKETADAQEEGDSAVSELKKIEATMRSAGMPPEALKIAEQELRRLKMMAQSSSEFQVTLNYLDTLVGLPWNKSSEDKIDIDFARTCLEEDHFGLDKVKERILEFLAVRKLVANQKGSILCLAGPAGVGKTSIAKSIARAMSKEYIRMALGGMHDEAEIRGHRKTYIGAMPGRVMQSLKKVGVNNPVFVLDEIDKLCKDHRGDPASALLEVLDPEQNNSFQDNYINTPFDLSKVFFIVTANDTSVIPPALKDRLEIINISGYSPSEKIKIAQKYLIPKQKKEKGLENLEINISENALAKIVEEYTGESGVRSLERQCATVMRKIAVMVASDKKPPTTVGVNLIPKLLGPPKVFTDKIIDVPTVGISTGLAWSQYGGSVLFVESMRTPGKGNIKVTGNAGKVLQESADAAFTWIRSHSKEYGVDLAKINEYDIHVHLPAGATPKDGPSAGIAMTASLLSTILNVPVRNDVAMTGEISLRGRVLPIGGLKEKVLAAHRAGIKTIIFPKDNLHDTDDIPADVLSELQMVPVTDIKEALKILLSVEPVEVTEIKTSSLSEEPIFSKGN